MVVKVESAVEAEQVRAARLRQSVLRSAFEGGCEIVSVMHKLSDLNSPRKFKRR